MKDEKKGAHNMTEAERNELQYKQQMGEMPMTEANIDPSYKIPASELHMIHAELEIKQFNPNTGEKMSVPKVQTFYPKEFADLKDNGGFVGYSVKVVHNPDADKAKGKNADADKAKPLNKKEITALKKEYKELYGEDAPEDMPIEEVQELVTLRKNAPLE